MKKNTFSDFHIQLVAVLIFTTAIINAQNLPLGYVEQYSHPCNKISLYKKLVRNNPDLWKINSESGLNILPVTDTIINTSIAVLDSMIYGEYIVEFEFKTGNIQDSVPSFSFLTSMKSGSTYYTSAFSDNSISFFLTKSGNKILIDTKPIPKLKTGWNKVRVEWNILSRNTTITINNDAKNKLIFNDNQLVMGFLGFSNGHNPSFIKNLKIWAATVITDTGFTW